MSSYVCKLALVLSLFIFLVSCGGGGGSVSSQENSGSSESSESPGGSPSPETSTTAAQISVLYNPASATAAEKTFINSGLNIPGTQFTESRLIFMSDIQASEVTKAKAALEAAAGIFGHYDIYFYGLGADLTKYNNEVKTSACNVFGYSDCNGGTMQYLREIVTTASGNAGANINGIDFGTPSLLIYQGTNGGSNIGQITVIHEYVHIFQHAAMLGMGGGSDRKSPAWFTEGMAQYMGEWLGREKGFSSDSFSTLMSSEWDNAYTNRTFHVLKDQIDYKSDSNPKGLDGNKYGQPMWAIAYMIELASARTGVTNGVQVVLNDLVNQVRTKGWETAFSDNVGITVETFYTQFNALIEANDKTTRLTNLVTSNVASVYVPSHNYSVLQLSGASTAASSGGTPAATTKTIYYYDSDTGQIPSYQGSVWPYVKADTVTKPSEISAEAEVQGGYVLLKSAGSNNSRPIYQYSADTSSTSNGNLIAGWSAIDVNGRKVSASTKSITLVVPTINDLPSAISVNENQTAVVTISASDGDYGETLNYSVSGADAADFGITSSGVLSFQNAPDYETKNSYSIVVTVSDGTYFTSSDLTVDITNINESPSINSLESSITAAENQTAVVTVSASDPDIGTTLIYSLTGTDAASLAISSNGVITFNSAPDYETKNTYNLNVNVSDGSLLVSQALTINISNVIENYSVQRGSDIDGNDTGDNAGSSLSLSSDGSIVAVGAGSHDSNKGHVRVYAWNGSAWIQRGSDIDGENNGDRLGDRTSTSLSSDGSILAIGAYAHDSNKGQVRVYAWNGSAWIQRGNDLDGEAADDQSGNAVSLSSDGSILAIGALEHDSSKGHVKVYAWDGSAWSQRGSDLDGDAINDKFGGAVSLSSDGSIVAIGAMRHRNPAATCRVGHVKIFEWNGSAWIQIGNDIDGEACNDLSSNSVSLSSDGSIVAIGAVANDGGHGSNSFAGHVRVFGWDGSSWQQNGPDLDGDEAGDRSGWSTDLSADGTILAIGSYFSNSETGHVKIFTSE